MDVAGGVGAIEGTSPNGVSRADSPFEMINDGRDEHDEMAENGDANAVSSVGLKSLQGGFDRAITRITFVSPGL